MFALTTPGGSQDDLGRPFMLTRKRASVFRTEAQALARLHSTPTLSSPTSREHDARVPRPRYLRAATCSKAVGIRAAGTEAGGPTGRTLARPSHTFTSAAFASRSEADHVLRASNGASISRRFWPGHQVLTPATCPNSARGVDGTLAPGPRQAGDQQECGGQPPNLLSGRGSCPNCLPECPR